MSAFRSRWQCKCSPVSRRARGFTLVELAIVLAVMAILTAAISPALIESARTRMAERAADDASRIHDASKWFFVESAPAGSPAQARWPGETTPQTCTTQPGSPDSQTELVSAGYLTSSALTNPWGNPYEVRLVAGASPGRCALRVSTVLPSAVTGAFTALLPAGECGASCGGAPVPGGFSRCCTRIPKPGGEASVTAALNAARGAPSPGSWNGSCDLRQSGGANGPDPLWVSGNWVYMCTATPPGSCVWIQNWAAGGSCGGGHFRARCECPSGYSLFQVSQLRDPNVGCPQWTTRFTCLKN